MHAHAIIGFTKQGHNGQSCKHTTACCPQGEKVSYSNASLDVLRVIQTNGYPVLQRPLSAFKTVWTHGIRAFRQAE